MSDQEELELSLEAEQADALNGLEEDDFITRRLALRPYVVAIMLLIGGLLVLKATLFG